MIFEKASAEDIDPLCEMRILFLKEDCGGISPDKLEVIAGKLPAYFREHLNRDIFAFVCRDGDRIAGCCLLLISEMPSNPSFINGKTGSVLNVYTRPEYRRKGIAGKLMKMLLHEAEIRELDYVELKATDAGYSLYKSLGFKDAVSEYHEMKYTFE